MLVVTHEMAFARDVSSQVVFMAEDNEQALAIARKLCGMEDEEPK